MYRDTGPQVLEYNRGSYDTYNQYPSHLSGAQYTGNAYTGTNVHTGSYIPPANNVYPATNVHVDSNVHHGNVSAGSHQTITHSETRPAYMHQEGGQAQSHWAEDRGHAGSQIHGSRAKEYDYRRKGMDYKYNCFSMIDQPWNRCFQFGNCGTCPGNECIAKKTPKSDWL